MWHWGGVFPALDFISNLGLNSVINDDELHVACDVSNCLPSVVSVRGRCCVGTESLTRQLLDLIGKSLAQSAYMYVYVTPTPKYHATFVFEHADFRITSSSGVHVHVQVHVSGMCRTWAYMYAQDRYHAHAHMWMHCIYMYTTCTWVRQCINCIIQY